VKTVKAVAHFYITILFLSSGKPYDYEYLIIPPISAPVYQQPEIPKEKPHELPRRNVPEEYLDLFIAAAITAGIPPGALESIAWAESGFCPEAESPEREDEYRDLGMFQFNSKYLEWYAKRYNRGVPFDPMVPEEAVAIAAKHIRFLYERYNRWSDVFLAYNAGYGAVDRNEIPDGAFCYLMRIYGENINE
jgi:soluble lytic murein transglycosylase-like protein